MGKAKSSRKGKKAWRVNISSADVDQYLQQAAEDERSGGPLHAVSSESLFFVDKSRDGQPEKKTWKHRKKILLCDSILQRNSLVLPLPGSRKRKIQQNGKGHLKYAKKRIQLHQTRKANEKQYGAVFDIWGAAGEGNKSGKVICKVDSKNHAQKVAPLLPHGVEIDAPGCSYNPSFNDHQEALGVAAAREMQKIYQKDLEPPPIPRVVPGTKIDEEEMYFLDVDDGHDLELDGADDAENCPSSASRPVKLKRSTRAELNRKARRRAQVKAEKEANEKAVIEKDLQRLDNIANEIKIEEEEKKRKWIRRTIAKQEKRAQCPPRLGRIRFQPEPMQVLLSSEISGSMRKLKGCCTLLRDRYKSLQRRGILEPRLPLKRKNRRKRITYEEGSKGQKEQEMHFAMQAERAARRQALAVNS
eukprot:c25219_g1_i1 orf=427-1674(-)